MEPVYATAADLWRLALPPDTLFQDGSLRPGTWSAITKTGTGTGLLSIDPNSNPIGVFSVVVDCVTGGELNVYAQVNPGLVPSFSISLDGGVTFGPAIQPTDNGTLKVIYGGFTLIFANGMAPSFVSGDRFVFTTTYSPDIDGFLSAASSYVGGYLKGTYQPPYSHVGDDVKLAICEIARWKMLKKRGMDKTVDYKIYEPTETMKWLWDIAEGRITPDIVEQNGQKVYPNIMVYRQPFRTVWRF